MYCVCDLCRMRRATDSHHMLHGAYKKYATKYHLLVPLCHECHMGLHHFGLTVNVDGEEMLADDYYKKKGQLKFMEEHPDLDFLKIVGKNFL